MLFKAAPVLLLALAATGLAVPTSLSGRVAPEPDQELAPRHGWVPLTVVPPAAYTMKLTIALKQRDVEGLTAALDAVSDPTSKMYGKHLSVEDITALVAPADEDIVEVQAWLDSHGIAAADLTLNRDFLTFEADVKTIEAMFETELGVFSHKEHGQLVRALKGYTVPAHLGDKIDFVSGLHRFPTASKLKVEPEADKLGAHLAVTPDVLRKRYNVSKTVGTNEKTTQAVAQFLGQHYSALDLHEFWVEFGRFPHDSKVAKVVGPNHIPAGVEASLDIEYIMSLGANISTTFWSTGGTTAGQEPFLQWMLALSNTTDVPSLFSVSYGDDEPSLSNAYMQRVNVEFQKAGARGISLLFASGDSGASCSENNTFTPSFPASSPFVTTVGGTLFESMLSEQKGEVANYISGGGFSNVFSRPLYQANAVAGFKKDYKRMPPAKMFNQTGRGYPDVAALSSGFVVVVDLIPMPGVAGTSAAAPTFSGVVSLLNDLRLNAGKAPLGFLNPLLYLHPEMLYDVEADCSAGCGDDNFCAIAGWDAVTGLGTPNYPSMAKVVEALH